MIPPDLLMNGYRLGVFPMADDDGGIQWFSPDPRGIIPLEEFHVPHGLKRALRRNSFEVRVDTVFETVMRECAAREETWINEEIIASYCELHRRGCAHSVEVWRERQLVGGLYGVSLHGAFFGESMFHQETDASKIALHALIERLRAGQFALLDIQWLTPHLQQFGAREISREDYLRRLEGSMGLNCRFPVRVG